MIPKGTKCTPKNPNLVPEAKNQPAEAKTRLTTGKINRKRQKIKGPFNFKVRLEGFIRAPECVNRVV